MRVGGYIAIGLVALALVVLSGSLFTVDQTKQALVLYFGQPVRLIEDPGLHAKIPFRGERPSTSTTASSTSNPTSRRSWPRTTSASWSTPSCATTSPIR